jgi:DNA-binding response OmpR family regulator
LGHVELLVGSPPADKPYDLIIVSVNLAAADGLRLCSHVRSLERTRHLPIIVIVQPGEDARLVRALDMGVNATLRRNWRASMSKYSAESRAPAAQRWQGWQGCRQRPERVRIGHLQNAFEPGGPHASPRYRRTVSRNVPIEIGLEM